MKSKNLRSNSVNVMLLLSIFLFISLMVNPSTLKAQNEGRIIGKVIETGSDSPLPWANIVIVGTEQGAATDINGRFIISKMPPGTYRIKASFLGYQDITKEVQVAAKQTVSVDFKLEETVLIGEEVVVYGELTRGQAKALQRQKMSQNIVQVVSEEFFSRFPDRNAAETVARIPGIAISYDQGEGEVISIRGLGPDFNSLTVNGQRIPAPDPDLGRAVGLDLLNQELMENIVVTKALTPDMDGDAIGGNVNFQMKQAPNAGILGVNLGGGYNLQYSDFNEFGNDIIDLSTYGGRRFFNNKLGVLAAGSYYKTNRGSLLRELEYEDPSSSTIIFAQHSNDYDVLRERWGLNLNTEYAFDDLNKIFINLNHNRYFDKEIRRLNEWVIDDNEEKKETRNRVEDQTLSAVMFGGNHNFSSIKLDYVASWIKAVEDMPARTYFRFQRDFDFSNYTNEQIKKFGPSTEFSDQADVLTLNRVRVDDKLKQDADLAGQINVEIPYTLMNRTNTFKFGGKYIDKSAKFEEVRLELKKFAEDHTLGEGEWGFENVIVQPDDENYLGASKVKYLDMTDDNFDAGETVLAAYGMTTVNINEKLSVLTGLRFENTTNKYNTLAEESVNKEESDASYSNILPSAHFTYRSNEYTNFRLAYSTGISRPGYKSLTPYVFRDDDDREISKGNPDLKSTVSNNFDLMFENYSAYLGLFSAGVFYKKMANIVVGTEVRETIDGEVYNVSMPINGDDDATVYGFELALNHKLNFLNSPFLADFNIYANYTFTNSQFEVGGREVPLGFSPKHIVNLALMYDNPEIGLSFVISNNIRDDILIAVGSDKYTDVYYKKENHLDISVTKRIMKNLSLFLKLNNLTNQWENEAMGDPNESYSKWTQWAKFNSYGTLGLTYKR